MFPPYGRQNSDLFNSLSRCNDAQPKRRHKALWVINDRGTFIHIIWVDCILSVYIIISEIEEEPEFPGLHITSDELILRIHKLGSAHITIWNRLYRDLKFIPHETLDHSK